MDEEESLISLHVAEYSSLFNRATNWIVIEYLLMGALASILTIVIGNWKSTNDLYCTWGLLFSVHIYLILSFIVQKEHYLSILYIEQFLRNKISKLLNGKDSFWRYEKFLAVYRKDRLTKEWEWISIPLDIMFIGIFIYHRYNYWQTYEDTIGLVLVLIAATLMIIKLIETFKVKRRFTAIMLKTELT